MKYRQYKSIGRQISVLSFGAMRLPRLPDGKMSKLKSTRLIRMAYRNGINYFDTARVYGESEEMLGHAVKPFRDKVIISTKNGVAENEGQKEWLKRFDISLEKLQTTPDILNLHGLQWDIFCRKVRPRRTGILAAARKAQSMGLFKHLAISSHDTPKNIIKLLDTGEFVGITLQYNLLDRRNEPVIEYAHKKGLGVVIMGPVAGGRLAAPSEKIARLVPGGMRSNPEIAMRFVMANGSVTTALSGMSSQKQLSENLLVAEMDSPLNAAEKRKVLAALAQMEGLAKLYCTGCGYCMPCPNKVNIPYNFVLVNYYRIYGLKKFAKEQYATLKDPVNTGLQGIFCKACRACLKKCPQKIEIIDQLKEVHAVLGE